MLAAAEAGVRAGEGRLGTAQGPRADMAVWRRRPGPTLSLLSARLARSLATASRWQDRGAGRQAVSPSGMAEPTPRTAPWDRAGLPAPRHPQERTGRGGLGGETRATVASRDPGPGESQRPAMSAPPRPRGGEMAARCRAGWWFFLTVWASWEL